ncbi:DUF502 domain-containing protein [Trichothermofontia sichuanensis B231]|uniref:DUF502 domain-containing protein n=1 Tax=Trichothermofontia sichuanensis TaxID=3045816 RepID=UPI0022480520|nr:DUF502 domain-containing protein [Trichothermofontia sichuanensis]UZQ55220.1 DUF502 domain-containing protein [Trichothermofontia sichuanensis B231]
MFKHLKQDLKNDLIAGLLVVIPLATTIWLTFTISTWVVGFLTRVPKQLNPINDLDPLLINLINLALGLAVPLLSILLIGLMARNIVGRWLLDVGERVLQAIPFAGSVYKTLKQLLETLLKDSSSKFRRVVLVEYPRRGLWAIAFVTGNVSSEIEPHFPGRMLSVFIPTTPNPTTGWYAIVPEAEVITVSMSIEDAFKVLISGGIVNPSAVNQNGMSLLDPRRLEERRSEEVRSETLRSEVLRSERSDSQRSRSMAASESMLPVEEV